MQLQQDAFGRNSKKDYLENRQSEVGAICMKNRNFASLNF